MSAAPKERLAFLDVARGLAALLVLAEHGLGAWLPGYTHWALRHIDLGQIGVLLFLLVSGFIIPVSLEQGGSNARFWLRRCFRLFPAYWLSIVLGYGACRCVGPAAGVGVPLKDGGDWLLNLTMLQGFLNRPHVWGVFWTLQFELVVYAACSVLFACRLLSRSGWIAGMAFAGYALLGLARPLLEGKPFAIAGMRYLYFAPLVGMIAQRWWEGRLKGRVLIALLTGQGASLALVWGVNHALFPAGMTTACLRELAGTWGIAGGCFFLLLLARGRRMPAALCRWGRISYSVYLLHPLVLGLLAPVVWPGWVMLPCLAAGTVLLAEASYRLVEAPGVALGRAVERRWFPAARRPTPAAATPSCRAA